MYATLVCRKEKEGKREGNRRGEGKGGKEMEKRREREREGKTLLFIVILLLVPSEMSEDASFDNSRTVKLFFDLHL